MYTPAALLFQCCCAICVAASATGALSAARLIFGWPFGLTPDLETRYQSAILQSPFPLAFCLTRRLRSVDGTTAVLQNGSGTSTRIIASFWRTGQTGQTVGQTVYRLVLGFAVFQQLACARSSYADSIRLETRPCRCKAVLAGRLTLKLRSSTM